MNNLQEIAVQRREATLLLRKIISFSEIQPFTCVYLSKHPHGYELHVKADRDKTTLMVIQHVALQEGLLVREEAEGFVGIYTPQRRLLELAA
jgi:hypothetical protein